VNATRDAVPWTFQLAKRFITSPYLLCTAFGKYMFWILTLLV